MPQRLTGFSPIVRKQIKERAGGYCEHCGAPTEHGQCHHRRPRGAGGSRRPETNQAGNGLWVCRTSHEWIESNRAESLRLGLLVPQVRNPEVVVVKLWDGWVLLDNLGGRIGVPAPDRGLAS